MTWSIFGGSGAIHCTVVDRAKCIAGWGKRFIFQERKISAKIRVKDHPECINRRDARIKGFCIHFGKIIGIKNAEHDFLNLFGYDHPAG